MRKRGNGKGGGEEAEEGEEEEEVKAHGEGKQMSSWGRRKLEMRNVEEGKLEINKKVIIKAPL